MLDRIIVNAIYLVPLQVSKFKKQHPEEQVLIADGTKARKVKSNQHAQYEVGWATARRGVLMLTTKNLRCGDWIIPLSTIHEATLLYISGGTLLKISTDDDSHYQFGLQRNPAWENQTVFPLKVEQGALKFSTVSLVLRLLILIWITYVTGQIYFQNGFSLSIIFYLIIIAWLVSPFVRFIKFPKS
ncbi:MAG: hypothetical protein R3309_12915 [Reinekea sp.]|nr:hypothetical protein [Reinekea sp.]